MNRKGTFWNSNSSSIRQIARIRLARLLITEKKPTDSIQLLQTVDDKYFSSLINEVRGDAYFAMRQLNKAKQSYHKAMLELPSHDTIRPILQMKYDNLPNIK